MSNIPEVRHRKAFGAFYTPEDTARYMAAWTLRANDELVLEPSVGDGMFVRATNGIASARGWARPGYVASEIDPVARARVIEAGLLAPDELRLGDFLDQPVRVVDAVIGNPPYVRLRALTPTQRDAALSAIARDAKVAMDPSGSVWMPFVSRSTVHLRPGGRMALVLPWDFTYVRYARPLWQFLAASFGDLRVVRVRARLFSEISQDVLLLFAADKGGSTETLLFETYESMSELFAGRPETSRMLRIDDISAGRRVFQEALLPVGLTNVLADARELTVPARELVTFNIGYVSGDKNFFHPPDSANLPAKHLVPTLTNARKLKGGGLFTSELSSSAQSLLWLPTGELTSEEHRYEATGRAKGIDQRYKCRVREPWYRVPYVRVPDIVVSVFAQRPILMINDGAHVASNSLLCGYLNSGRADEFAASWYSSLTLLNAELEVHSLGGGVLVLVPNEAGNIRVLSPALLGVPDLEPAAEALRRGNIDAAYANGDNAIADKLGSEALELIRQGVDALERWRTGRSTGYSK